MPIRLCAALLALVPVLWAGERDAGHAPAERWAHPRGAASGSGRSLAAPIEAIGPVLWEHKAKAPLLFPPLVWEGAVFLIEGPNLIALDASNGRALASQTLQGSIAGSPALSERALFLLEEGTRLVPYALRAHTFERETSIDLDGKASGLRIHEGEIYVTTSKGLLRMRRGRRKPAWKAEGAFEGDPAVFGDHIYAFRRETSGNASLVALARRDGSEVARIALEGASGGGPGGALAVSEGMVAVQSGTQWTFFVRKQEGAPSFELIRGDPLRTAPLLGSSVAIALSQAGAWVLYMPGKQPVRPILPAKARPELVDGAADPVGQGELLSFGSWAADLNANEIHWHVSELRPKKDFRKGVRFAAIPAGDERMLLVTPDAKSVQLVGPEEIGS